ncbi:MAG TPA: hypothetical protein PLA83_01535, partial [Deltaproteobacteria bacterium]|nr:hypothetical protein [Deltaproteobacteria bacterium]
SVKRDLLFQTSAELIKLVRSDLDQLIAAGVKPSVGDVRCIVYGHVTRMVIWNLRKKWDATLPVVKRLVIFADAVSEIVNISDIVNHFKMEPYESILQIAEQYQLYGYEDCDAVSF